ncbi:SDR family NAD(P)-dependent oxidoreductase [Novosphingobium sp. BW1]|nr:SDR family NAD(P)-dependent oxidoreductase [Novosphingobium sp. BW1]
MSDPKRIFLTGASGHLGRALARLHAVPGVELTLWGRDTDKLEEIARTCREAGAKVGILAQDLEDTSASLAALRAADARAPIDLAYLVAGLGDTCAPGQLVEPPEQVLRLAQVNFAAPAALASALAARMAERGTGRIVLIGSAAGHHALPFAASYAASKAGLARFAQALRIAVAPRGVQVTLAVPGFLATPGRREASGAPPMLLEVDEAARRIAQAAREGRGTYVTPWIFRVLHLVDRTLPGPVRARLLRAMAP